MPRGPGFALRLKLKNSSGCPCCLPIRIIRGNNLSGVFKGAAQFCIKVGDDGT